MCKYNLWIWQLDNQYLDHEFICLLNSASYYYVVQKGVTIKRDIYMVQFRFLCVKHIHCDLANLKRKTTGTLVLQQRSRVSLIIPDNLFVLSIKS